MFTRLKRFWSPIMITVNIGTGMNARIGSEVLDHFENPRFIQAITREVKLSLANQREENAKDAKRD